jgi:O-methyltransferase
VTFGPSFRILSLDYGTVKTRFVYIGKFSSTQEESGTKVKTIAAMINSVLSRAGLRLSRIQPRREDPSTLYAGAESAFVASYEKYRDDSMVPWQGMHDAFLAAKYIANSGTPGDIVECGVFRGGIVGLMKDTILQIEKTSARNFWLFDTFEGMPKPGPEDFKFGKDRSRAISLSIKKYEMLAREGGSDWCLGELRDVENTLGKSTGGLDNTIFVQGMVEETLHGELVPEEIALLRLDTDFYESTKVELEVLLPRLSVGGILIVDDYGTWAGSRKAVQEIFLERKNFATFINHRTLSLLAVKTSA